MRTRALTGDDPDDDGATVCTLDREDGAPIPADIVVFSAGIRPRDQLARDAGLAVAERGGVVVDDQLATSDADVSAIGEVASVEGRCLGLVAPGYDMARVLAARLAGSSQPEAFTTPDLSTKLKLLGIDVASFGDAFAGSDPADDVDLLTWSDATAGVYKRLARRRSDGRIVGGMLVGDASDYQQLRLMALGEIPTPADLSSWVAPSTGPRSAARCPTRPPSARARTSPPARCARPSPTAPARSAT